MASPQLQNIVQMLRARGEVSSDTTPEQARAAFNNATSIFQVAPDIATEPVDADGVPCEWTTAPTATDQATILYLHGGGYTLGSIATHRDLVSRISRASGARALSVEYRLAPEHPFPAGLDDALTAYRWLLKQNVDPSTVVIAGDSAGGGLAAATLLALRDAGEPLPAAAVLISPWLDLTGTGESMKTRADLDPMIPAMEPWENPLGQAYAGDRPLDDPGVSPLFADLSGLPPLLIHAGDHEVLLSDSTRFAEKAEAAGVDVQLEVWDEMIHVWHFMAAMLPEGQTAIDEAGEWIKQHVATGATA